MPQMAPMNWLALTIIFSFIFITFNMMNFYMFKYKTSTKLKSSKKISYKWSW